MNDELRCQALHEFRVCMERKLIMNNNKPCFIMNPHGKGREWKHIGWQWLLKRLRQEVIELEDALQHCGDDFKAIQDEAADVANFAMMLHSNANQYVNMNEQIMKERSKAVADGAYTLSVEQYLTLQRGEVITFVGHDRSTPPIGILFCSRALALDPIDR